MYGAHANRRACGVQTAWTSANSPEAAIAEIAEAVDSSEIGQLLVFFPQPYEAEALSQALSEAFAGVPRDHVVLALMAEGVSCSGRFYSPLNEDPLFSRDEATNAAIRAGASYTGLSFPVARRAAYEETIWLPHEIFLGSEADVQDLVAALAKVQTLSSQLRDRPPGT